MLHLLQQMSPCQNWPTFLSFSRVFEKPVISNAIKNFIGYLYVLHYLLAKQPFFSHYTVPPRTASTETVIQGVADLIPGPASDLATFFVHYANTLIQYTANFNGCKNDNL